jgi:hypothetical protein
MEKAFRIETLVNFSNQKKDDASAPKKNGPPKRQAVVLFQ